MRRHPLMRAAAGTLAAVVAVAVVWWLATPAGLVGSVAGTFILAGVILILVGLFLSAGADRVADNLLPGANVGRMAEQGLTGERRFLAPRRRGAGILTMLGGTAYLAVGALLWSWR